MFRDKQTDIDTGFCGRHRAPPAASAPRAARAYCIVSIYNSASSLTLIAPD
jgi:hypothetical protein